MPNKPKQNKKSKDAKVKKTPAKKKSPTIDLETMKMMVAQLIEDGEIQSAEEAEAFMDAISGMTLDDIKTVVNDNPESHARNLAFEAMEAETPEEAWLLCHEALKLDPDCIDAAMLLARIETGTTTEYINRIRQILFRAEAAMGIEFMQVNKGRLWTILETRPYLVARAELVLELLDLERFDETVTECESMLNLNSGDNQGVRYTLLSLYLMMGKLQEAQGLFKAYPDDCDLAFYWGKALERCLSDDLNGAAKACKAAKKRNKFVYDLLIGREPMPHEIPMHYTLDSEDEAVICVDTLEKSWKAHPQAFQWLREQA
jgi:hypothetical protein